MKRILITGGYGFIGSHLVRHLLLEYPGTEIVVLDKVTYAANRKNLADLSYHALLERIEGDICDVKQVSRAMSGCDAVIHVAAETHVDRSIAEASPFVSTNVLGTSVLLDVARARGVRRFHLVSTDEIYGSTECGYFDEDEGYNPTSPYAASKAAAELLALSYWKTYGFPVVITRGSNTYGPCQLPDKLIPKAITCAQEGKPFPLYSDGSQRRDWMYVTDHARGIDAVFRNAPDGAVVNLGAGCERTNRYVVESIYRLLDTPFETLPVPDRPGHDFRYAIGTEAAHELGWWPRIDFEAGLIQTVNWYQMNRDWWS